MNYIKNRNIILLGICLMISISYSAKAQSELWVAPQSANDIKNPLTQNEESTKSGKKLYNQLCSICHGDKGKGDGMAGAALKPKPSNFTSEIVQSQTDGAIFWKITNGRSPMAAYKDLIKEDERWNLVNYIRTLKK